LPPIKKCREFDSLDSRRDTEPSKKPIETRFHCAPSHIQLLGYLGVIATLQQQFGNLLVALAEAHPVKIHAVSFPDWCCFPLQHLPWRTQDHPTTNALAESTDNSLRVFYRTIQHSACQLALSERGKFSISTVFWARSGRYNGSYIQKTRCHGRLWGGIDDPFSNLPDPSPGTPFYNSTKVLS
jgi:hypothetical protein